jgi:hypothetical protein
MHNVKGTVMEVGEVREISDTFRLKEVVIKIYKDDVYPQNVPFTFVNDDIEDAEGLKIGDDLDFEFKIRSNWSSKYERYFLSLNIEKYTVVDAEAPPPPPSDDEDEYDEEYPF